MILERGQRVVVINCDEFGAFYIESREAILQKPSPNALDWLVRMGNVWGLRYIDPAAQEDPDAYVSRLNSETKE